MFQEAKNYSFTATTAAVGEVGDAYKYDVIGFVISGLATETISVTGSMEGMGVAGAGTNFSAAIRPTDMATGALAAASALPNGSYKIENFPYGTLKFTKSAGVDTVTIRMVLKARLNG